MTSPSEYHAAGYTQAQVASCMQNDERGYCPCQIEGQCGACGPTVQPLPEVAVVANELELNMPLALPKRGELLSLEAAMREFPQVDCPLQHTFAPGAYARTIAIPAGTGIIGKIHKHAHLNIVSRGRVTVVTEFGRETIDASVVPVVFTSEAGAKRALACHTDVVWTTIHLTDSKNLADIERDIIAQDYAELDAFLASECRKLISA